MTRLLGVSGSQRAASHSRRLVELLLEEARACGAETRLLDLRQTSLPILRPDDDEPSPNYTPIREMVLWADALVLAGPDYHGSMSGAVKNFLDHYWREFTGKLFGYVVASHEKGLTVQDQMRTAVRQCYGWSLPYGIGFNGNQEMDLEAGTLQPALAERVRNTARDLTVYGALLHGQFQADLALDPRPPGFASKFKLDD